MDEWQKSLDKLLHTPPHEVRQHSIHALRLPNEPEPHVSAVLRKMNEGHALTDDEVQTLPESYRAYYLFNRDAEKGEASIIQRYRREEALEKKKLRQQYEDKLIDRIGRKTRYNIALTDEELEFNESLLRRAAREGKKVSQARDTNQAQDKEHYEMIMKKLQKWQPLSPGEQQFIDNYGRRKKNNQTRVENVEIDSSLILTDVINGDYSLQDVHLVKEGAAALNKDSIESSPIQLLEQVLESMKKSTQDALQTSDTDHFFDSIDSDLLNRITPLQINEIISSCKTGIEMLHGNTLDENESKSALESFIKALVMSEGENKIKEALKAAEKKLKRREDETLAEIGKFFTQKFEFFSSHFFRILILFLRT